MAIPREDFKNMNKNIELTSDEIAYIAGFLDGDGCLLAQLIRREDYRYGYQIRISIYFYQKTKRHWFLLWMKKKLRYGTLRKRNDGMSEYCIVGTLPVQRILTLICDKLRIKHKLCKLILTIIEDLKTVENAQDFLQVALKVDQVAQWTDSKKRKITASVVENFLKSP
uniref:Putative LAGLIDADG homing endonuclease n=1 Tax=Tydemania expeditionis TaxID=325645 RepID=A0A0D6E1I0_TYDEX|nr:putative LAGLIDADG homing endonuclease [Tydemania expeditionis]CEO91076.1 putative LAGLIDADG homing endonuclease [Tydemania expeditionis]